MQMRVQGGDEYINYVNEVLHGEALEKKTFTNYDFKIINDFKHFNSLLYQKEKQLELCRMLAGYAWEWKSKKDPAAYDICIDGVNKKWNHCLSNWVNSPGALDEVGCIHTVAGYDLNYAFVIIGKDLYYDRMTQTLRISKSTYFDKRGKQSASDAELDLYIKNIYYVLLTRGIRGTYVYVCDDALKDYLIKFVDVI